MILDFGLLASFERLKHRYNQGDWSTIVGNLLGWGVILLPVTKPPPKEWTAALFFLIGGCLVLGVPWITHQKPCFIFPVKSIHISTNTGFSKDSPIIEIHTTIEKRDMGMLGP